MTQAQLAAALGVASTSVHRWEAGTSNPDFKVAVSLWSLAIEYGSPTSREFAEFLANRAHAIRPLLSAAQADRVHTLDSAMSDLSPDELHLVLAFIEMVKHNEDPTADQMLRVLLEPWRQKVLAKGAARRTANRSTKRTRRIESDPEKQ